MNTEQREARERRLELFKKTPMGEAFFAYKEAIFRARRAQMDDEVYQALEEAQTAEDKLIALAAIP